MCGGIYEEELNEKKTVDSEPERYYDWMVWKGRTLDEAQTDADRVVETLERIERKLDDLLGRKDNSTL